jgi:hypothetical protein
MFPSRFKNRPLGTLGAAARLKGCEKSWLKRCFANLKLWPIAADFLFKTWPWKSRPWMEWASRSWKWMDGYLEVGVYAQNFSLFKFNLRLPDFKLIIISTIVRTQFFNVTRTRRKLRIFFYMSIANKKNLKWWHLIYYCIM